MKSRATIFIIILLTNYNLTTLGAAKKQKNADTTLQKLFSDIGFGAFPNQSKEHNSSNHSQRFSVFATNDVERVKQILKEDPEILNALNIQGKKPIHIAAQAGADQVVSFLLEEKKACPDELSKYSMTPLYAAAFGGSYSVAKKLTEANADVNKKLFSDQTALHGAVINRNFAITKLLLEHKARVNAKTYQTKRTPLHYAAKSKCINSVHFLLEKKANPNMLDNEGNTPLHLAILTKDSEIVQLLAVWTDLSITNRDGKNPYEFAEQFGNKEIRKILQKAGAPYSSTRCTIL